MISSTFCFGLSLSFKKNLISSFSFNEKQPHPEDQPYPSTQPIHNKIIKGSAMINPIKTPLLQSVVYYDRL
jgi:hypothetical protein